MNVVREDRAGQTALIKVTVEEADYMAEVDKKLHEYKRKANMPGFRPGMVPMSIVSRLYRKSAVAESSYKIANEACFNYLKENNIEYLGDVMPSEEQGALDFDNNVDHQFVFEVGLAPVIDFELTADDKVVRYDIAATDQMRDSFRQNFLRRFGRLVDVDEVTSDEALTGLLDNGTIRNDDAYVGLISMSEEERKQFAGKKVGDSMIVNVNELYKSEKQRATVLGVDEKELKDIAPEFTFTIAKIRKYADPEMNEEFYKEAFPEGNVTDAAQFDAYIESEIGKQMSSESDYFFANDVRQMLAGKATFDMPEDFLRRWLFEINEGKYTKEQIESDFPAALNMMRWNAMTSYLFGKYKLDFNEEDVLAEAKKSVAQQFAQYGMMNLDDQMVTNYAHKMLENQEQMQRVSQAVYDNKVIEAAAERITVETKQVTVDELGKIMAAREQK